MSGNPQNIFYGRLAQIYDRMSLAELKLGRRLVRQLELQPGEGVLEIGCGTGRLLSVIRVEVGPNAEVLGVELSPDMLEVARKHIKGSHPPHLLQADARHLPLENSCFDVVILSFTLELFEDKDIALVLSECQRVLRRTGRLGIVCLHAQKEPGFAEKTYRWFHRHLPSLVDCRPIDVKAHLSSADFEIVNLTPERLYGIPAAIVTATKKR